MSRTRSFLSVAVLLSAALPCAALDFLSPEEEAELELKRKKEADPVLTCAPVRLNASVRKDEKTSARLTVLNAGGRTLQWSVTSAPEWASPDPKGGELGFEGRQALVLSIDPSALPDGATRGEIVVEAPGAKDSPARVAVVVEVLPVPEPGGVAEAPEEPVAPPEEPETVEPEVAVVESEPIEVKEEAPRERAPIGLGVRAGALLPGAGEKENYSSGLLVGLFWRPGLNGSRLGFELGVRFGQVGSDSGVEESAVLEGTADALWHMARNETLSVYAVGGLSLVAEQVKHEELGTSSNLGSALNLGAGATVESGLDVRVTYLLLLGSENVGGALGASLGYMF